VLNDLVGVLRCGKTYVWLVKDVQSGLQVRRNCQLLIRFDKSCVFYWFHGDMVGQCQIFTGVATNLRDLQIFCSFRKILNFEFKASRRKDNSNSIAALKHVSPQTDLMSHLNSMCLQLPFETKLAEKIEQQY
jgi:hypothetical protein